MNPEEPHSEPDSPSGEPRDTDPSTLFLLWSDPSAPLEEEIRLALDRDFPGIRGVDDLETSDEVPWGTVFALPDDGGEVSIWAELRGELGEDLLRRDLENEAEFAAAKAAKWMIGCEVFLRPGRALADFHQQLRMLASAAIPGLHAVYDDNASIVRSGRQVQALARSPRVPTADALFALHDTEANGNFWVHTHGLQRASLPEVDLLEVPTDALEGAHELIVAVVEGLLTGLRIQPDDSLLMVQGGQLRALPLERAMPLFSPDTPGGQRDREGNDAGDHAGPHLVLLDPERAGPPLKLLRGLRNRTLIKSRGSLEARAELARQEYSTFGQLFFLKREEGWRFFAKFVFGEAAEGTEQEHLWFEVTGIKPQEIRGKLVTPPFRVAVSEMSSERWLPFQRLTEWRIASPDREYGPEQASELALAENL
jgi:hypothetical protein